MLPVNRTIAGRLIPWFIRWGVSANGVTAGSLFSGLTGAFFLMQGNPAATFWGAFGFWLANVLDECDGEIARRTHTASGFGSWFDTVSDCLVHVGFFVGLGIGLSSEGGSSIWMVLGILTGTGVFLSYLSYVAWQIFLRGKAAWLHPDPPQREKVNRGFVRVKEWLRVDFSLFVLLATLAGHMGWLLWGGVTGVFLFWIPSDFWMMSRVRR